MGNYKDLEFEFIERTIALITQYNSIVEQFPYKEQFNYTLIINCLLGLIVMPKERIITYIPNYRLTADLKKEIGLENSEINDTSSKTLRDLIQNLRNSIAHFDIEVVSEDKDQSIDWIKFKESQNGDSTIIKFKATEIMPFLKYYSNLLLDNLEKHRN